MSKLNRNKLQKLILQEFKMLGMGDMDHMGMMGGSSARMMDNGSSCGDDPMMPMDNDADALLPMHTSDHTPIMGTGLGQVSREDCCAAVMCLIECCSCPVTKAALMECCEDIMAGDYDH
tara:strand:+ start:182 stop:538 length:357 start_codon:yes stop_codon:yes gene_type:complete